MFRKRGRVWGNCEVERFTFGYRNRQHPHGILSEARRRAGVMFIGVPRTDLVAVIYGQ